MKSGKAIARFRAILMEVATQKGFWSSDEIVDQIDKIYKLVLHEILTENPEEVD